MFMLWVQAGVVSTAVTEDSTVATCEDWCDAESVGTHCTWCKCGGCPFCAASLSQIAHCSLEPPQPCTSGLRNDADYAGCASWCRATYTTHCAMCACRTCDFCREQDQSPPEVSINPTSDGPPSRGQMIYSADRLYTAAERTAEFDTKGGDERVSGISDGAPCDSGRKRDSSRVATCMVGSCHLEHSTAACALCQCRTCPRCSTFLAENHMNGTATTTPPERAPPSSVPAPTSTPPRTISDMMRTAGATSMDGGVAMRIEASPMAGQSSPAAVLDSPEVRDEPERDAAAHALEFGWSSASALKPCDIYVGAELRPASGKASLSFSSWVGGLVLTLTFGRAAESSGLKPEIISDGGGHNRWFTPLLPASAAATSAAEVLQVRMEPLPRQGHAIPLALHYSGTWQEPHVSCAVAPPSPASPTEKVGQDVFPDGSDAATVRVLAEPKCALSVT